MNEPVYPFCGLKLFTRVILFAIFTTGSLIMLFVLERLGQDLKTDEAPSGIVSFEFAGDNKTACEIIDSWKAPGQDLAAFHLKLDYLFLVLYPLSIATGCALAILLLSNRYPRLASLGVWLGWGQVLAGVLDAIENGALLQLLNGSRSEALPIIAWWCAAIKFALVVSGLIYLIPALILGTIECFKNRDQSQVDVADSRQM